MNSLLNYVQYMRPVLSTTADISPVTVSSDVQHSEDEFSILLLINRAMKFRFLWSV